MTTYLIIIIALALIFDYINGFHDAANSIATVVSTKVLTPFQAVLWAALFNFVAYFIFKDHGVANTIAKTVKSEWITLEVIFSGLIAAITWNLLTWWSGIPSSSSHTLIGGFAGAAIAHAGGFSAVIFRSGFENCFFYYPRTVDWYVDGPAYFFMVHQFISKGALAEIIFAGRDSRCFLLPFHAYGNGSSPA